MSNGEVTKAGFWGERTATIDWCEINYEVTYYIAEFWNTVSNLVMILFPLYGIFWSYNHIQHAKQSAKTILISAGFQIPATVIWCHLGLISVGIGSWMFHMTLLYPMQLLDELPMIYGSAILIYANYDLLLSIHNSNNLTPRHHRTLLQRVFLCRKTVSLLIAAYCLIVTFVYLFIWHDPIFHEVAYSLMVATIVAESATLITKLKSSKRLYLTSFVYYMFGFLLWNLDNNFCSLLKSYRSGIESLFGLDAGLDGSFKAVVLNTSVVLMKSVFEFHSLWHVFTGYASFMTILFITDVHYQFHLRTNNQMHREKVRPVESTLFSMYYYLANSLLKINTEKLK